MDEIPLFCDSNDDCQMYQNQGVCCADKVPPKLSYPQGLNPPKGICIPKGEICLENGGIDQPNKKQLRVMNSTVTRSGGKFEYYVQMR